MWILMMTLSKGIEAIINSMTPFERQNPASINGSRKNRIANGSGSTIVEVNRLLKQFDEMSKMMRMVSVKQKMPKMKKKR